MVYAIEGLPERDFALECFERFMLCCAECSVEFCERSDQEFGILLDPFQLADVAARRSADSATSGSSLTGSSAGERYTIWRCTARNKPKMLPMTE